MFDEMPERAEELGGRGIGWIWECLMKEVSVKRKGSSLREGQGVDRRVSEEVSLSFWRGNGGEEEEESESSRVSASWRTKGSEKVGEGWRETLVLVLDLGALVGVESGGIGGL